MSTGNRIPIVGGAAGQAERIEERQLVIAVSLRRSKSLWRLVTETGVKVRA